MKLADKFATALFFLTFGLLAFLFGVVAVIAGVQSLFLETPEWLGFAIGIVTGAALITTVIYGVYRAFWGHEERNPKRLSVRDVAY